MSRNIPTVKTWIVTTDDRRKFLVLGPTKRLAIMNFRHAGFWMSIETVGLQRKQACGLEMVTEVRGS